MEDDTHIKTLYLLVLVLVLVGGFSVFRTYQVEKTQGERLVKFSDEVSKTFEQMKSHYDEQLGSLQVEQQKGIAEVKRETRLIKEDVGSLESSLEKTKKESQENLAVLSEQIEKVETESAKLSSRINTLKAENEDFSGIIEDVIKAVVSIRTNVGSGSGVLISSDGLIVTNHHVINGATSAGILTYDGQAHPVAVVGYNDVHDIAILKIEGSFSSLEFGNSDNARVGEKVIAIGAPAGLDFTVTQGIVSAVKRTDEKGTEFVQHDVPINPGNSGGPLVNSNGKIIGINTMKKAGFEGLGFAISSNLVRQIVDQVKD